MDGLNSNMEDGRIWREPLPDSEPATLNIKVAHGLNEHEVAVPSGSTFGDLKSVIVQKFGLNPENHKLLFRGKVKEEDDFLRTAGVKDNSKVLLMEDTTCSQKSPEPEEATETETTVVSRGEAAVAKVREEVDELALQVAALQAVVDSGTQVDNKDILYLTEMLMRQLLKLDAIDAEGEGRVQRKMEVRRVQSFVDTMDILKSKNSNPSINGDNGNVSVTTHCDEFENGLGSVSTPSPISSPAHAATPAPLPSSPSPSPMPSYTQSPVRSSTPGPNPRPSSATKAVPFCVPISTPSSP